MPEARGRSGVVCRLGGELPAAQKSTAEHKKQKKCALQSAVDRHLCRRLI